MKWFARILKVLTVLTLIIGSLLYINAKANAKKSITPRSFVATYQVSRIVYGGAPYIEEFQKRIVKDTGEYRVTKYAIGERSTKDFITADEGQYEVKKDSVQYLAAAWPEEMRQKFYNAKFLASHPEFVRTEEVAGLIAYVLRSQDGERWTEEYYAPETGPVILKRVACEGSDTYYILEAINVQFRNVTREDVALPNLPKIGVPTN